MGPSSTAYFVLRQNNNRHAEGVSRGCGERGNLRIGLWWAVVGRGKKRVEEGEHGDPWRKNRHFSGDLSVFVRRVGYLYPNDECDVSCARKRAGRRTDVRRGVGASVLLLRGAGKGCERGLCVAEILLGRGGERIFKVINKFLSVGTNCQ